MREIKFKVWDNVDFMSAPFTLQDLQLKKIQFTSDCQIIQFTGLKDKKNVDCYEKDYDEDGNMIDWCDNCCGYQFKMIDIPTGDEIFCHNCDGNFMLQDHISDFEIVGNRCEIKAGRHEA
jgi:hypothetical protein